MITPNPSRTETAAETGQPTHWAVIVPPCAQVGGALRHDAVAGGPLPRGSSRECPRPRQRVPRDRVPVHAPHAVRVVQQHAVAAAAGARRGQTLRRGAADAAALSQRRIGAGLVKGSTALMIGTKQDAGPSVSACERTLFVVSKLD